MPAKRIHYYLDNDDELTACGRDFNDVENDCTDDDAEITCKKCEKRAQDYEEELEADEEEDEEDEEDEETVTPVKETEMANRRNTKTPAVQAQTVRNTVAPAVGDTDRPGHPLAEPIILYKRGQGPASAIAPSAASTAPAVRPTVPAPQPINPVLTGAEKLRLARAESDARKAAAQIPVQTTKPQSAPEYVRKPGVTVMTPNTPAQKAPAADVDSGQLSCRLTKLEAQYADLTTHLTSQKIFSRMASLENRLDAISADLGKDDSNLGALFSVVKDMDNRLTETEKALQAACARIAYLEDTVADYLTAGVSSPDLRGIDPGNAPAPEPATPQLSALEMILASTPSAPPVTPPVVRQPVVRTPQVTAQKTQRTIPARGTGKLAEFSNEQCLDMVERYSAGEKMSAIALAYGINNKDNKGSKLVWHLIKRGEALLA